MKEKTFGMIKPNSVNKNQIGRILTIAEDAGLKIVQMKYKHLSKAEAESFYEEHKARPFFGSLVSFMTSGPAVLMVFEGDNAVAKWREIMGATDPAKAAPGTIRKLFADSIEANSVHGSADKPSADREVPFFFKNEL